VPLAPLLIVIQDTALDAVHAQTDGNVTVTEPCPPLAPTDVVTGAIVAEQTTPACVTVNVCPPTVTVPVRLERLVLAAME
jgi:hypothetical protein